MKNHSKKYPDELKIKAGEMFESGMTAKQIATELGVPKWVAFYLEYEGRKLKGILPTKREYIARPLGRHPHSKRVSEPVSKPLSTNLDPSAHMWETTQLITPKEEKKDEFKVQDFVENNVDPVPTHSKFTAVMVLIVIVAVAFYAITH